MPALLVILAGQAELHQTVWDLVYVEAVTSMTPCHCQGVIIRGVNSASSLKAPLRCQVEVTSRKKASTSSSSGSI